MGLMAYKTLMRSTAHTAQQAPCNTLPIILGVAPKKPYKTHSNRKYPPTITNSPKMAERVRGIKSSFSFLNIFLNNAHTRYATSASNPLIIKVAGAYKGKARITSPSALPTAAARLPYNYVKTLTLPQ